MDALQQPADFFSQNLPDLRDSVFANENTSLPNEKADGKPEMPENERMMMLPVKELDPLECIMDSVHRGRRVSGEGMDQSNSAFRLGELGQMSTVLVKHDKFRGEPMRFIIPNTVVPRQRPWPPSFLDQESQFEFELASETECYYQLIADGGIPSHDIKLGRTIVDNPGNHHEIVSYWRHGHDSTFWQVFQAQLSTWTAFREEQLGNRSQNHFPQHCLNVQRLLHNFDYQGSYQLHRDLHKQDKLSDWVEFLAYNILPYGQQRYIMNQERQRYEDAVAIFMTSPLRRAHETVKHVLQRSVRDQCSKDTSDAASLAYLSKPFFCFDKEAERKEQEHRLAMKKCALAKEREDLMHGTYTNIRRYVDAAIFVANKVRHLNWIVKQIPLITQEILQDHGRGKVVGKEASKERKRTLRSKVRHHTVISAKAKRSHQRIWKRRRVAKPRS